MPDAFPPAPLYSAILDAWRRDRAWMRYVINSKIEDFERTYPRRIWRVYLRPYKLTRNPLEPDPVSPVPGAPLDYKDDPLIGWQWKQQGAAPARRLRKGNVQQNKMIQCWWPWPQSNVPTVQMLVSTDHVGYPMKTGTARAYIADFRTLRSMVMNYYGSRDRFLKVIQALGGFSADLHHTNVEVINRNKQIAKKRDQLEQRYKDANIAPRSVDYLPGTLVGWPAKPSDGISAAPDAWPKWVFEDVGGTQSSDSRTQDDSDPDLMFMP